MDNKQPTITRETPHRGKLGEEPENTVMGPDRMMMGLFPT